MVIVILFHGNLLRIVASSSTDDIDTTIIYRCLDSLTRLDLVRGNRLTIDVDDARDLAMEYNVSSIPCVVLFKDGKEADRSVGLVPREVLEDFLG